MNKYEDDLTAACVTPHTHRPTRTRTTTVRGVGRGYFAANARATSKPADGQTAQSTVAALGGISSSYRARVPSDASARALPLSTYTHTAHGYDTARSFTFRRLRTGYDFVGFFIFLSIHSFCFRFTETRVGEKKMGAVSTQSTHSIHIASECVA